MATQTPDTSQNPDRLSSNKELVVKTPLTQRRYTPYTKSNQRTQVLARTPLPNLDEKLSSKTQDGKHSRRKQRSQEPSNEKGEDISSRIVNKSWRLYRVSPLYRLKMDATSLKSYEKRLNSFLAVETCGTETQNQAPRKKALFTKLSGDTDEDYGLEIKIITNENAEKEELVAVLCSCGQDIANNENIDIINGELTSLPVCLIKSPVALRETFLQWLENQFGCRACPLLLSPTNLAWLGALCIGIGEVTSSVEFTYTVPAIIPELDTIYFKMDAKDARRIWNLVHDPKEPFFTNDEAVKILNAMETHFYHHFKVHLNQMQLTTVGTPIAYIGQEGRIKLFQKPYVYYILQQLSQLANS